MSVRAPLRIAAMCACVVLALPAAAEESMTRDQRTKAAAVNTQLALTYMKQGELQAAREKIDKALQQNPRTADTQMAAGFVYDRLGDQRKARNHFEQAVKLGGKDNPDVLNNAAQYFCRKDDRKRGEQYFLQAAESPLNRMPEIAYTNAGLCARADGRPKDAERYFRQALALRPNLPDPLYQLADLFVEASSPLQARAFLERYLAVAPASAASLWLGYQIESALGERAAADGYATRLKDGFPTSAEMGRLLEAERGAP